MAQNTYYLMSAIIQATAIAYALTVGLQSYLQSRVLEQHRWDVEHGGKKPEDLKTNPWYQKQPPRLIIVTILATTTICLAILSLVWISDIPEWVVGMVVSLSLLTFGGLGYVSLTAFLGPAVEYWEQTKYMGRIVRWIKKRKR
ncbi:MAG: hypothetical protein KAW09_08315 [Thermoplasmata archaeon]|nr:hypothetical protein [Thermoplasmata archaeon]